MFAKLAGTWLKDHLRNLGHRSICLRCGRSLASRVSHLLHTGSPRELRIYNVIQEWIMHKAIEVSSRICHAFWVAADRAAVHMVSRPSTSAQASRIEEIQPPVQFLAVDHPVQERQPPVQVLAADSSVEEIQPPVQVGAVNLPVEVIRLYYFNWKINRHKLLLLTLQWKKLEEISRNLLLYYQIT